jgi:CPA1 family monovalent cation:H+ antiporter
MLTCGGVFLTLVPAGLALPFVLRAVGLAETEDEHRRHVDARVAVAHAALQRADELAGSSDVPEHAVQRAREAYEARIAQLLDSLPGEHDEGAEAAAPYRRLRREMLTAERNALEDLSARREVTGETLREIERELDLEETRLNG